MTKYPEIFAALAAPFEPREVKQLKKGKTIRYVTARTIMNRLDEVLGPENWCDDYTSITDTSAICRLTITLPDGKVLTKADAGGAAGMADSGDDDKSMISDAFKRAAVKFGVSRYLYEDGVPNYGQTQQAGSGARQQPTPSQTPRPSHDATPRSEGTRPAPAANQGASRPQASQNGEASAPRSGKALFAWLKEQEQVHSVGVLKYVSSWAKLQEFPEMMVDWDAKLVALAHAEAVRKLQSVKSSKPAPQPAKNDAQPESATKLIARYSAAVSQFCDRMNRAWLDRHTLEDGEIPSWVGDVITSMKIVDFTLDKAGAKFPNGGNHNERMKAAAEYWVANEQALLEGWTAYVGKLAAELKAKHSPPEPEDENQELATALVGREPGSDDDMGRDSDPH